MDAIVDTLEGCSAALQGCEVECTYVGESASLAPRH